MSPPAIDGGGDYSLEARARLDKARELWDRLGLGSFGAQAEPESSLGRVELEQHASLELFRHCSSPWR
uniref:Uncharacterized protein n=1 Tax=Oryza glumipatula TaxID=40148 RepID=A0A0E0BGL7_9ORYZ